MPLRTVLIDDEPLAISRLERLLSSHTDFVEIVGKASNGAEGLEQIEQLKPDLIFLDIEMPLLNGFEMLAKLDTMPLVVFATAYDAYAIKAFEENSIDYLLKPIEAERLAKTIDKLKRLNEEHQKPQNKDLAQQLQLLMQHLKPEKAISTISVKTGNKILLISLGEICFFEADDKYVFLKTLEGHQHLSSYTINTLEEKLPYDNFLRVNRSTIVNLKHIKELEKYFNGRYILVMKDLQKTKIQSSATYSEKLREHFDL
jgi:two-component system, LytTR family, response regulator